MGNICCCCLKKCEHDQSYYFVKRKEYCTENCLEKKVGDELDV